MTEKDKVSTSEATPKTTNTTQTASAPVKAKPAVQKNDTAAQNPRIAKWLQYVFVVLVVAIIGFAGGWLGSQSRDSSAGNTDPGTSRQRVVLNNQGDLISAIAEEVGQSTVSIDVTTRSSGGGYWWGGGSYEQQSAGTGVIITKDGLVVTNRHVVPEGTTSVSVVLSSGKTFEADVVGRTLETDPLDIAFLKMKNLGGTELVPATLGNSSDMKVGHNVIAIGNALGQFQNTVTMGILSGYGRNIVAGDGSSQGESLEDLLQTDAAINQGNSGGPLVNINGEVIGINTAVAGGGAENIGFAIPIDNVKGLIANVEKNGSLKRPYLGVVYAMLNEDLVDTYNLKVDQGAFILPSDEYGQVTIVPDSPAGKAGLKEGDVITKIDDIELNEDKSLASALTEYSPGDTVNLTVNRNGETVRLSATLESLPTN